MGLYQGRAHRGLVRNRADEVLFLNLDGEYRISTSLLFFKVFAYVLYMLLFVRKVSQLKHLKNMFCFIALLETYSCLFYFLFDLGEHSDPKAETKNSILLW